MAKKKKDDQENEEDYINEGGSENIDDADDNFGLPDVDYTPVDRDSPEETPAEEESQPEYKSEWEREEETTSSYDQEETTDEYADDQYKEETTDDTYDAYASSDYDSTNEYESDYVDEDDEGGSNTAVKAIVIIGVLLVLGAAAWYFISYRPEQNEIARQQALQEQREQARADSVRQAEEQIRLQREAAQREADRLAAEAAAAEAEPEVGTVETISDRTGRYYVVIASALDGDLAMDFAKDLANEGQNIKIIEPFGNSKFHRVAIADMDNWDNAQSQANELKGTYGDEVWVVKY